jgi:hypothetical protein
MAVSRPKREGWAGGRIPIRQIMMNNVELCYLNASLYVCDR